MDCFGHALTSRSWMHGTILTSMGTLVGAMIGGRVDQRAPAAAAAVDEDTAAAREVLAKFISVDVHTHGGTTGITSMAPPNDALANGMRAGSLAVACLADVPDGPVLGRNAAGVLGATRTPQPGELYRYHLDRLAGWTRWRRAMACAAPLPPPISRPRMPPGNPPSSPTSKRSISWR